MLVKTVLEPMQVQNILDAVSNSSYNGNVRFRDWSYQGQQQRSSRHVMRFTLRVNDSSGPGARRAASGRRTVNATWYVHYAFMSALLECDPNAVISTALETYKGVEQFLDKHADTYHAPAGSLMCPVSFGSL